MNRLNCAVAAGLVLLSGACTGIARNDREFAAAFFAGKESPRLPDNALVLLTDFESGIVFASPSLLELSGYTAKELEGENYYQLLLEESAVRPDKAAVADSLQTGQSVTVESEMLTKEGTIIYATATIAVTRGADGKPAGVSRTLRRTLF
ncbi:MAG: PAS domain-containing protein [Elusimicrobiaceae bacterium]|nr:PAS domain-containing protein [Elusimicrobiaceae bacterium]